MKVFVAILWCEYDSPKVKVFSSREEAQNQLYAWGGKYLFDFFKSKDKTVDDEDTDFLLADLSESWLEYSEDGIESACWGEEDSKIICWIKETELS